MYHGEDRSRRGQHLAVKWSLRPKPAVMLDVVEYSELRLIIREEARIGCAVPVQPRQSVTGDIIHDGILRQDPSYIGALSTPRTPCS